MQKVLHCLEGGGGAKYFIPRIVPFRNSPIPLINDQSLISQNVCGGFGVQIPNWVIPKTSGNSASCCLLGTQNKVRTMKQ